MTLISGGHAENETDAYAVALREAREETGLQHLRLARPGIYDVDVHQIPARGPEPAHLHYDVRFAFYAERSARPIPSDESHEVAWISLKDLPRYRVDDSVLRLAAKTPLLDPSFRSI